MAPVGAILDEGQQEADVDLLFFIPSALRYARGMAGGSELDFGLVCTGVYDQYAQGLEGLAVPIIGPSFTFRKQLLGNDRVMLMGSLGATGFVAPWVMDSLLMFGAGASGGVTFGWQPTHGFGVFVPVELAAMAARHNNQQITAIPGLGLSWELWGARMKLASDWPLAILAHGGGGSWNHLTLGAVPYYGFEIGYRW